MYTSAFVAQTAFHWFPKTGSINELNFSFSFFGFVVSQQPDISGDASAVLGLKINEI
jgi:hypothetical protein